MDALGVHHSFELFGVCVLQLYTLLLTGCTSIPENQIAVNLCRCLVNSKAAC